jgi:hypothetical protein
LLLKGVKIEIIKHKTIGVGAILFGIGGLCLSIWILFQVFFLLVSEEMRTIVNHIHEKDEI